MNIDNYHVDDFGIIHQKTVYPITYDEKYVKERYDTYGEKVRQMSFLRLGYLLGAINKIPKSILDVGYGNGDFLKTCVSIIPECFGNDVTGYPLPDNIKFVEDIFENYYEVISFFDVLEHFENINIIQHLKCDYIIISVPWCYNHENTEWFLNWKHLRPNEHLHHFNEKSLIKFFEHNSFQCVCYSNVEDAIRKDPNNEKNILTAVFKKI